MIGQIIGNYKVEQKIGEGGMGAVFRGVDMMLEREVAIKFLRPELSSQPQVVERFRSEAVTLAKLNHPNIATLYNFMRHGDSFFMVLEFVRGVTLDQVLQQRGAIPCEQAIPLFCQVLDGIHHAHEWGIIHRDIKPANMMLTEKGILKVLDFGIARILGTARMTRQGNIIGTIEYMSPEQVRGMDTDARSDIYSLGMLLYELLTGRCPFDIQNEFELMKAQIEHMPVPPRQLNHAIPEAVEQGIWKAIAKNPQERFQSAAEFRTFLLSAGYAATGRLEPLAVGDPNPYATRPLNTQSPMSNPAVGGYATVPQQTGYPTPSQPGTAPQQGAPPHPGSASHPGTASNPGVQTPSNPGFNAAQPHASNPGADAFAATMVDGVAAFGSSSKETRIGSSNEYAGVGASAEFDPMKATRVGTMPAGAVYAPQQMQQPPHQQQQSQSFLSKLTWVHFAGAGVAALFALVAAVGLAFFALSGSKPAEAPVKPAALNDAAKTPAAPQPTAPEQTAAPAPQPEQQGYPGAQTPGGTDGRAADSSADTSYSTVEAPAGGGDAGRQSTRRSAPRAQNPVAQTPAPQPPPAQPKARQQDSAAAAAAEKARRRRAAEAALEQ